MTDSEQLAEQEGECKTLRGQYEQASQVFFKLVARRSKKEERLDAFNAWHKAGTEYFNAYEKLIATVSRLGADKDPTYYTHVAETALNLLQPICVHYDAIRIRCQEFEIDFKMLQPSPTAFANIQRIVSATHNDMVQKWRDEFANRELPTHGFDRAASEKPEPHRLETRYFVIGAISLAIAAILGIWGFAIRDLSEDQRTIFRAFMSIAGAFSAWSFSGTFSVTGKHPATKLIIAATGGFAVWVLSHFFL